MANHDEEDLMIGINREGLEQAAKGVQTGGAPVCIATEVAEQIPGMQDAELALKKIADEYDCDLVPSHIVHRGDLVPGYIFTTKKA